jgi:hypothetical protein
MGYVKDLFARTKIEKGYKNIPKTKIRMLKANIRAIKTMMTNQLK